MDIGRDTGERHLRAKKYSNRINYKRRESMTVNLTNMDVDSILFLVNNAEEDQMKGTIRVKGKCENCGGKFTQKGKLGFLCEACKCRPERYWIDLPLNGERHRIFSDDRGYPLDTFKRTSDLLSDINYDLKNGTFDPKKYRHENREKFYLNERWAAFKNRQTNKGYRQNIAVAEAHIFDYFRKTQDVRNIEQTDINLFAEKLLDSGKKVSTVRTYLNTILAQLHYDKAMGLQIKDLEMPKFSGKLIKLQSGGAYIPTIAETLKILSLIPLEERDVYLFTLTHGCRPAESRAIKAKDFNWTNNTVRFVRSFSAEELQPYTKTYENEDNAEALPIHMDMINRLRQLCMMKNPDDFLFTTKKGKPFTQSAFRYRFFKAATAAGYPNVEPYRALKHASLSSMASESSDIYNTSKLARHATTAMTEKHYTRKLDLKAISKVQMTLRIPKELIPKN